MENNELSIGLPQMHLEPGERRVFLTKFVAWLADFGFKIYLEEGYGSSVGLSVQDYLDEVENVRIASQEKVYQQDFVLVLRFPGDELLGLMKPGSCLISMLHFPTRPQRVLLLKSFRINAISLDTIKDDNGRRLVENLAAVAWNGLKISFQALSENYPQPGFENPGRNPLQVTLLGAGAVGKQVIQAAVSYGDKDLREKFVEEKIPGVMVTVVDYDLTNHRRFMQQILSKTDILVDATQRPDPSKPVIPNHWLAWLPEHGIITDLAVDPYLLESVPPVVRGIEGIPQGNLDKYLFSPADPEWDLTVPTSIPSEHRRTVVSCYSWPGIFPKACMKHYGQQLRPLMKRLSARGYEGLSLQGDHFERALYRGTLRYWQTYQEQTV